ncbi:MAG: hypothetical protein IJZ19_06545 [Lentisphaeria bacterium]|nr:hypothetical protein [Lentisphaeria bacterium]
MAKEWYGLAKSDTIPDGPIFAFFATWVAFNCLYGESTSDKEYVQIKSFCNSHKEDLRRWNVFDKNYFKSLTEREIHRVQRREIYTKINFETANDKNKDPLERKIALLQIIYCVRCNLFHGEKVLADESTPKFCQAGFEALDELLSIFFKTNVIYE